MKQLTPYYIKQKAVGLFFIIVSIILPMLDNGNATFSLLGLPLGLHMLTTRKKLLTIPDNDNTDSTDKY